MAVSHRFDLNLQQHSDARNGEDFEWDRVARDITLEFDRARNDPAIPHVSTENRMLGYRFFRTPG